MAVGLSVGGTAFAAASFLLQFFDFLRSFRFSPIFVEFFPSFTTERLQVRTLRASHRLVFCDPLIGIFLRIE